MRGKAIPDEDDRLYKEQLLKYYKNADLKILPDSKFRQYKVCLQSGRWITLDRRINTVSDLRKVAMKYLPKNFYQSSACFANGKNVKRKPGNSKGPGYKIKDNLFMYNDLVFDSDEKDRNLAYINTLNIAKFFRKHFSRDYDLCVQTERGYHLHYYHFFRDIKCKDPIMKEQQYQFWFEFLRMYCQKRGLKFDNTCLQTRRIFRVPNSVHSLGLICRPVNIYDMKDSMREDRLWI